MKEEKRIDLHPEDAALREEVARLRASLTVLLLQRDDLVLVQCKRVEAAYLRRFGPLELKVYEAWCACLRAKRKARLIRAEQNRRSQADLDQIEAALDGEMAAYQEELTARFRRVEGAMDRRGSGLTQRGLKEARDLYLRAVKALHPDLHPDGDELQAKTLEQAMRAYRAGDLETLRDVCETLTPREEDPTPTLEALRAEAARLRSRVRAFDRELEEIKAQYPYSARCYLEDEALGQAREAELQGQLRDLRARTARYEAAIAEMLREE